MDDLSLFCCQNTACSAYGKRNAANLSVCAKYGRNQQRRLLYCRICKARFSERKGTVFFRSRLPNQKVISILEHLGEGVGMRKTARLVRIQVNTTIRYAKLAGQHAKDLHDEIVAVSPSDQRAANGRKMGFRRQKTEKL